MITTLLIYSDTGIAILRIVLALVLMAHGLPKLKNLKQTAEQFSAMGFKRARFWGTVVAVVESLGGLLLLLGFFTQIVAVIIAVQFLVATLKVKLAKGLVGGYEFDLLILAAAFALITLGGGAWSLDSLLRILVY